MEDLTNGEFRHILDDPKVEGRREKVERLVLCTGKIYYDMDGIDAPRPRRERGDRPGRDALPLRQDRASKK